MVKSQNPSGIFSRILEFKLFNNHPINGLQDEMRDDQTAIYNLSQIIKFTRNIWRVYALSLIRTDAPMLFVRSHHVCFARKCSVLINFLILDIRTQLNEQLRCLDTRLECQQSQLLEIQVWAINRLFILSGTHLTWYVQDVFKRRAEIELNYSRDLEKLSKLLTSRHKEQKLKVCRPVKRNSFLLKYDEKPRYVGTNYINELTLLLLIIRETLSSVRGVSILVLE